MYTMCKYILYIGWNFSSSILFSRLLSGMTWLSVTTSIYTFTLISITR